MPPFNTGLSLDAAGVDDGGDGSGGTIDVVFANDAGQGNAVFLNAGDGTGRLIDTGQALGSANSKYVAVGDLDNDGDSDAVFANATGDDSAVYLNDGTGTFSPHSSAFSGNDSFAIGLADTDSDGFLDFVFGDNNNTNEYLFLERNDQIGGFEDGVANWQALVGEATSILSLAIADFDNDGFRDDMYAGAFNYPDVVYLGSPLAFVASPFWFGANGTDTKSVAAGDLNGDGNIDVFVGRQNEENRAYLNDGAGDFSNNVWTSPLAADTWGVALADLDGDGDLDAFVANSNDVNRVYLNDGTGSFSLGWQSTLVKLSHGVALGDLDGDGDVDAVVANDSFVQFNIAYMNNGDATFTGQQIPGTEALGSDGVAVGKLD
ncbi:MAG: hypothetical protein GVY14_03300 [Spirochaetes bacterium]|nr:hypothetical protein [Spirochaetota bacterium]